MRWELRLHVTCRDINVIYFLKCNTCHHKETHIGKTVAENVVGFKSRINQHNSDCRRYMVQTHASFMQVIYEYIRVTYGYIQVIHQYMRVKYKWNTNTYAWHMGDIWVTYEFIWVTYKWHTSEIRMTYKYIWMVYEWHTGII